MLERVYSDSELVLGLIGPVGTQLGAVRAILEERLKVAGYKVVHVHITTDVIPDIVVPKEWPENDEFARLMSLMDAGNEARLRSGDNSILALGAAAFINLKRAKDGRGEPQPSQKQAYIISSLKHPEEVARLRAIYPEGFYLIGVHADRARRMKYLLGDKRILTDKAEKLIERDEDENLPHGQRVTDAFHLSDFFVRMDNQNDHLKQCLWRLLDLLFGNPYVTPTFDEYAMFLAFAASLRSADLSRQVGAVVAVEQQIVATGANDCPRAGGGQYWSEEGKLPEDMKFPEDGRDFALGYDSNKLEQQKIIDDVLARAGLNEPERTNVEKALKASRIRDLTEFGRIVHAEMEALLSCGRVRVPLKGGTVYTTTFPCHNCAKHVIAAGIQRVVFIEPYPKSKAEEFHPDAIQVGFANSGHAANARPMVHFEPFVGVGPRRFFDLFSLQLGSGYPLKRKDAAGKKLEWQPESGRLRLQMLPASYLDLEIIASNMFNQARSGKKEAGNAG
jgi:deoxycytidylate deaminase